MSARPKTMGTWIITAIKWVVVIAAVWGLINSLRQDEMLAAIGYAFLAVVVIIAVHTPKPLERFLP